MNWTLIPFEKLYSVDSRNGLTKPSKVRGSGFKMINMGELFANDRIYDIPMELVPLNDKEKVSAKVEKDDLLFARQSLVLEGAGKCSIVMDVSPLTVFESHIIRVRLNQELANPLFYYYYFRSPYSPIKTIVSQCAQAGIRGSDLQKLEVVFPPIETQNRIADILSAYDNLIENNQKQIKLLEEAAQRLYKEWFVDMRFPGHENVKIVDGVPEGWKKKTLEDICCLSKTVLTPKKIPSNCAYIGLEHMPRKSICLCNWGNSDEVNSNKYQYDEDDIIFGKIRPYFHKVGFALNKGIASTDSIIMKSNKELWSLLLTTVSSVDFVDYTSKTCKEGSKMPRADWDQMKIYPVLIPDKSILELFNNNIWNITRKIKTLALQCRSLSESRDRLLPKLMSGELEV